MKAKKTAMSSWEKDLKDWEEHTEEDTNSTCSRTVIEEERLANIPMVITQGRLQIKRGKIDKLSSMMCQGYTGLWGKIKYFILSLVKSKKLIENNTYDEIRRKNAKWNGVHIGPRPDDPYEEMAKRELRELGESYVKR